MATREGKLLLTAEDRTAKAFDSIDRRMAAFAKSVSITGAAVATAAVGAAAALTRRSMQSIDEAAKQADRLNAQIELLTTYKVAADLAGVGAGAFADALQRQVVNLGKARDGTGEAAEAVRSLGLNVNELAALQSTEQFEQIAAAIAKLPTSIDQASAAAKIWGARDGAVMLNLIREMGPETEVLRAHLDAIGVTISRIDAAQVEAANDALELATQAATGLGNQIAVAVSPFIEAMAKDFNDTAAAAGGFREAIEHGMMAAAASVGVAADVIRGIEVEIKGLEVVARGAAAATSLVFLPFLQPEVVEATVDGLRRAREEFEALVNAPMPSEDIQDRFFAIREQARANAEGQAGKQSGRKVVDAGPTKSMADRAANEAAKEAAKLEEYLGRLYERNAEAITGKTKAALDHQQALSEINELVARGVITEEQHAAAVERVDQAYARLSDGTNVFADQAARNIQGITSGLISAAMAGENLGDVLVDSLRRIAAELAAQAALRMIFNAFSGSTSPVFQAIGAAGQASMQGRASGGPVAASEPYIVGERGPELFVPRSSGYIVPNHKMGSAPSSTVVNITQNVDARNADAAAASRILAGVAQANAELERRIYENLRRGTAPT